MPRMARALFGSTHPGPSIAVTIITICLGIGVGLDPLRIVLLGLAMLAGQFSIGLSNDWIDADRDSAVGRKDKPISSGEVRASTVRDAAWSCAALTVLFGVWLGWLALAALVFAIALGWAYNLGLKKTPLSIVPYVLSFGTLPALATLARVPPAAPALWALGVGGLLGAAGHFANTLPDIEDDRQLGVRGLPQLLGRRASSILTYVVLLAASLLEVFGAGGFGFPPAVIGFAINLVLAAVGLAIIARPTRWHFRFIIIAALVDVVVLVFAGARIIA